jgi:hypothetical protein
VKIRRLPFSVLLPAAELVIWIFLVPTQFGLLFLPHHASSGVTQSISGIERLGFYVPKDRLYNFALEMIAERHYEIITAINLPGIIPELLISLPTTWPSMWQPHSFTSRSWRAIAYPFYCLPFWWILGKMYENALAGKHRHWSILLAGTVLSILFLVGFLGLQFSPIEADRTDTLSLRCGLALWALMMGAFPFHWIRQWRSR